VTDNDKLLRVMDETGLVRRLEPTVISKASPPSEWLLQARADINREAALQEILRRGKQDKTSNDELADHRGQARRGVGRRFCQGGVRGRLVLARRV